MFLIGAVVQILICAVVLKVALFLVARYEADTSITKAMFVVMGINMASLLTFNLCMVGKGIAMFFVGLGLQVLIIFAIISVFCWISWWKSIIVFLLYSTIHVALFLGMIQALRQDHGGVLGIYQKDLERQAEYQQKASAQAMGMMQQAHRKQKDMTQEMNEALRDTGFEPPPPMPAMTEKQMRRAQREAMQAAMQQGYPGPVPSTTTTTQPRRRFAPKTTGQ